MTDSDQRKIVRKKFSLTEYHDDLLDEVMEQRYASRSEALRAAVQHHARYLSDDAETGIESLQNELEQITNEINTIQEKIDERNSNVVHISGQASQVTENENHSKATSEIENLIVKELARKDSLLIEEIAENIGEDMISVIPVTDSLREEGIICPVSEGANKYELNSQI